MENTVPRTKSASDIAGHIIIKGLVGHDLALRAASKRGLRFCTRKELFLAAGDGRNYELLKGGTYWMSGLFWLEKLKFFKVDEKGDMERVSGAEWLDLPADRKGVYRGTGPGPAAVKIHRESSNFRFEIVQGSQVVASVLAAELPAETDLIRTDAKENGEAD